MKKLTIMLSILAMFGFTNAQFSNGLTDEVPNLRVNAMGGIYSLIETSNYADYPQRLLTGQEGAWLGRANGDVWGLARFNLNNFMALPMPMAWQVSAEQYSMVSISQIYNYIGLPDYAYVQYEYMGMAYEATNRINSNFAIGINDNLIAGVGLKMYSNSNSWEYESEDYKADYEHSFWGLETTWGGTMILDDNHFIDASIDLDFWSWDGKFDNDGTDEYETGYSNCDGIWNFGLNGRYYVTGEKVDYAPYMKFNYFSFTSSRDYDNNPVKQEPEIDSYEFNGSLFNFTLGSGVHYKPANGVKVYNEFEFRYQSASQENPHQYSDSVSVESYQSRITLLPIYRMGVELTKEIDPKTWWGFNSVQLWGGFNKTFDNVWTGSDNNDESADDDDYENSYTEPTFEYVNVTTGVALQNGNFKIEFQTDVSSLNFDEAPLDNMSLGLVYMFQEK